MSERSAAWPPQRNGGRRGRWASVGTGGTPSGAAWPVGGLWRGEATETAGELRDGKGATNGSGAQHGSVSGPLDSPTPARNGAKGRGQPQEITLLELMQKYWQRQ